MKKKMFLVVAALSCLSLHADEYPYLTFQTTEGGETSVAIESLVITIADGKLLATNANGTKTFTLSELSRMYFTQTTTDIEEVDYPDLNPEGCEIYNLNGCRVGQPTRGVYVVKQNGITRKIVVK